MKSLITLIAFLAFYITPLLNSPLHSQATSSDIYKDIKKLGVLANVLYVGAHPDDENYKIDQLFFESSLCPYHLSLVDTWRWRTKSDWP